MLAQDRRSGIRVKAIVFGDAACGQADMDQALALFTPDAIAATNNRIIDYPGKLDYGISLHPDRCDNWPGLEEAIRRRTLKGYNRPETWAHKAGRGVDKHTPDWGGSTGLLAVKALIEEGFTRIVLCGVPLEAQPHFYTDQPWSKFERYRTGWEAHRDEIAPYVRSLSGWTRELLGPPDANWISD
jgi:hypothetical protein